MSARQNHHIAGFSLLEIMVVLVIIGGLFSFAIISMQRGDIHASMVEEVKRVTAYLEAAQEEAVLKNLELAMRFEYDSYSFLQLQQGKWEVIEEDRVFKKYTLPKKMRFYVEVLDGSTPMADDKSVSEAMVLILSSGEVSPFELSVAAMDGRRYSMRSNFMGGTEMFDPQGSSQ
ncbi:MAG: type II secretion system minor pseudopilin GspH [Gammaproteobacteria bacterium]|nr:type II secretion system minor pseudopilin GspH [Gammaproteobacteria bacterium]